MTGSARRREIDRFLAGAGWNGAAVEPLAADVRDVETRHRTTAYPSAEAQATVAAPARVLEGLHAWRRATQHHRDGQHLAPLDGDVAGRVAQSFLLLERTVVLFVDDDHAEVGERCQDRRAGADQHLVDPVPAFQPNVETLRIGHPGMQRRRGPEALSEASGRLRR